jgi:iron-sulfur cluster assembly protein
MTISITENAAKQIKKQLSKRDHCIGLKIGVKKAGCSGFAYTLNYADELVDHDAVFELQDVKIIINQSDLDYLKGIELDYRREGINEAFKFNNPNVVATCGCGESFTVA